jgi:hypothetical protein
VHALDRLVIRKGHERQHQTTHQLKTPSIKPRRSHLQKAIIKQTALIAYLRSISQPTAQQFNSHSINMKFTYIATGLMAALVSAQPFAEDKASADFASGAVTAEVAPQLAAEPLAERDLVKRANAQFTVFKSPGKLHPDRMSHEEFHSLTMTFA